MHMPPAEFVERAGHQQMPGMHWLERLQVPSRALTRTGEEALAVPLGTWLYQRGMSLDMDGVFMSDAGVASLALDFETLHVPGSARCLPTNRHAPLLVILWTILA